MRVALGLGSSLGDRRGILELALRRLAIHPRITLIRASRWYRTPPMAGGTARNWFLNGVALVESDLEPVELLALCKRIERDAGHRPRRHWGDRPLDLDLLVAEGVHSDAPELVLPHRGIGKRSFVLTPLLEVWPDCVDARTGTAYANLPEPPGPRCARAGVAARPRHTPAPVRP